MNQKFGVAAASLAATLIVAPASRAADSIVEAVLDVQTATAEAECIPDASFNGAPGAFRDNPRVVKVNDPRNVERDWNWDRRNRDGHHWDRRFYGGYWDRGDGRFSGDPYYWGKPSYRDRPWGGWRDHRWDHRWDRCWHD